MLGALSHTYTSHYILISCVYLCVCRSWAGSWSSLLQRSPTLVLMCVWPATLRDRDRAGRPGCLCWVRPHPITTYYTNMRFEFRTMFLNTTYSPVQYWVLLLSSPAARPVLVLKPENVSVRIGDSAQFYCRAKGDPPPAVVWSREQGPLPNGRYTEIHTYRVNTRWMLI